MPGLSCPARARPLAPERLLDDGGPSWDRGVVGQADPCWPGGSSPHPEPRLCTRVGRPPGRRCQAGPGRAAGAELPLPPSSGSPAAPGPGPSPSPHSRAEAARGPPRLTAGGPAGSRGGGGGAAGSAGGGAAGDGPPRAAAGGRVPQRC